MPALADSLSTLERAKASLGISPSDRTNDALIDRLIDAATKYLEQKCNRKFVRRNYNREPDAAPVAHTITSALSEPYHVFSGKGFNRYVLPQYPVDRGGTFVLEELSSRSTDGVETWSSSGYTKGSDYTVDWDTGIITMLGGVFMRGERNYRVTYEAGYEEPENAPAKPFVPADLELACIETIKQMYKGGGSVVTSERIGTWSRTFDTSKGNPIIEMTLSKYKAFSNLI